MIGVGEHDENIAIIDEGLIIENDTMSSVISKLQREVFVLTLEESIQEAPVLDGYKVFLRNEHEIEVEVEKKQSLNSLFETISDEGLHVSSMRTRSNRLEELFMRLVKGKTQSRHDTGRSGVERSTDHRASSRGELN